METFSYNKREIAKDLQQTVRISKFVYELIDEKCNFSKDETKCFVFYMSGYTLQKHAADYIKYENRSYYKFVNLLPTIRLSVRRGKNMEITANVAFKEADACNVDKSIKPQIKNLANRLSTVLLMDDWEGKTNEFSQEIKKECGKWVNWKKQINT